MKHRDAVALLEGAVPRRPGTWADFGPGDGTFTRALAELLGQGSRIYAVDRDASALASLTRQKVREGVEVIPVTADFTGPFELPGSEGQLPLTVGLPVSPELTQNSEKPLTCQPPNCLDYKYS